MKRAYILIMLACLLTGLWADETQEVYKRLYKQTKSLSQKFALMQVMSEDDDPSMAETMALALREMVMVDPNGLSITDRDYLNKIERIICVNLGKYRYIESRSDLMLIVETPGDPVLRAEALTALGRMRAKEYAEKISLMLESLNLKPSTDKSEGEQLALGCILSLGKMGETRGWAPVFFASQAWYSKKTRLAAEELLFEMVADPSQPIAEILTTEVVALKQMAFRYELLSKASQDNKISTSLLALKIGVETHIVSNQDKANLYALRRSALEGLIKLGDRNPNSVELMSRAWRAADSTDEKLIIFSALSSNGSDEAAKLLSDILLDFDQQRTSGLLSTDFDRIAKAAVLNAGLTKNPILLPVLVQMKINEKWSSSLLNAIDDSIKKIKGK